MGIDNPKSQDKCIPFRISNVNTHNKDRTTPSRQFAYNLEAAHNCNSIIGENRPNSMNVITILHQNICSLRNKTTGLEIWLESELKQTDVICLTEHWLNHQNLTITNIQNFKLASAFNRALRANGGSCIYVKESIPTKEIDCLTPCREKINFEVSLIELLNSKLYIVCIYRAPNGEINIFLDKLETLIQKLSAKNKALFLCGDWNIDLSHRNNTQLLLCVEVPSVIWTRKNNR
jgi:hypothetical protein